MANNYEHLNFPKVLDKIARLKGGGEPSPLTIENLFEENRKKHSEFLTNKTDSIINDRKATINKRKKEKLPNLPDDIPLFLQIDPKEYNTEFLYSYGFEVVSEQGDGYIIASSDEKRLKEFLKKVRKFKEPTETPNKPLKGTLKTASIYEISTSERIEKILSESLYEKWPFNDIEKFIVDISIECLGNYKLPKPPTKRSNETPEHFEARKSIAYEKFRNKINQIQQQWDELKDLREENFINFLKEYSTECELIDNFYNWIDNSVPDCFTLRIKITGKALKDLVLYYPYIFEVNEPDELQIKESLEINLYEKEAKITIYKPQENAPIVAVIDSGIQEKHQFLKLAIRHNESISYVNDEDVEDLVDEGGHGTRVAGAILYPNGIDFKGNYYLPCWIKNIKILDSNH